MIKKGTFKLLLAIILLSSSFSYGQQGSYVTNNNNPLGTFKRGPGLAPSVKLPTTDWCTSLFWRRSDAMNYSGELYAHPLSFRAFNNGLGVRYQRTPSILPNQPPWHTPFYAYDRNDGINLDFRVGVSELNAPDTRADSFSDWIVTADWTDDINNRNFKATIGHGLPFAYFTKSATGNATINFSAAVTSIWGTGNIRGVTVNNTHYGIFAPTGASWDITGINNINWSSNLNGETYWSVCALPDNTIETLNIYASHAFAFISNTEVSWEYEPTTAMVTTNYEITVTPKELSHTTALISLYRHQWLHSSDINTSYTYVSPRGTMKVMTGNAFSTNMKFTGVLPVLPKMVNSQSFDNTLNALLQSNGGNSNTPDAAIYWPYQADTYWSGKWLGRLSQLTMIAHQMGNANQRNNYLNAIKNELQNWFTPGGTKEFRYNDDIGVLIGSPASYSSDVNLNDHHFHYGYMIYAAAIVATFDPAWASKTTGWGNMVENLIKSCANWDINEDDRFPRLRTFDPYAGHSWANGSGGINAGANDQESSSESINFAAGLILWGSATCNQTIRDLGIYLYTTESIAVEQYWFDVEDQVHPASYNVHQISILKGNGGTFGLHWNPATYGSNGVNERHGINLIPVTPASLYLAKNPAYVNKYISQMINMDGNIDGLWKDIIWCYESMSQRAGYNATTAINRFNNSATWSPENGTSRAFTYHYINNMNQLGELHTSVNGDIPTSAVFMKGTKKSYVAYNPSCNDDITVTFSDGHTISNIGPNQIVVDPKPPLTGIDEKAVQNAQIAAYPNPVNENSTISIASEKQLNNVKISIFNILGKEIFVLFEGDLGQGLNEFEFDASNYPNGTYVCRISSEENGSASIKIIVNK